MKAFLLFLASFASASSLNAQNWESLPLHFNGFDYPLGMYYDTLSDASYIVGRFDSVNNTKCNVVKWDGNISSFMSDSSNKRYSTVVRYKNKLYFGGLGLASWDGTTWVNIPLDSEGSVEYLHVHDDKLYAIGFFTSINNQAIGKIAVWNDTVWTDLGRVDTVLASDDMPHTFAFYKGNFYIGGNFGGLNTTINEIAMYDGQRWTDVGNFPLSAMGGVYKLQVWNDTLYAAGMFTEPSGLGNAIVKWDGNNWHKLNNGLNQQGEPAISDLMVFNNELYAIGSFYIMDNINLGIGHKGLAKWDGSKWCWLGMSANSNLLRFGHFRDDWYALGDFSNLNGISANKIARWTGVNYTDTCSQPQATSLLEISNVIQGLHAYPNPSSGLFSLTFNYDGVGKEPLDISVTDLSGKVLNTISFKAKSGENVATIDAAGVSAGMYFVQINGNGVNKAVKVVKQ